MSLSNKILKTDSYILHTSVSGFSLLLNDLIFNLKTYGEVDYRVLWENNVTLMYLTRAGYKQAYELSKKLLNNSFFEKILNDSDSLNNALKKYKTSELNDKNIIKEWNKYLDILNEFCGLYRFYEQPFLQAPEEIVLKSIPEKKLVEYLSGGGKLKNSGIDNRSQNILEKLLKLGRMKLKLHLSAEKLITSEFDKFVNFVAKKNGVSPHTVRFLRGAEFMDAIKGRLIDIKLTKERSLGCALIKRNGKWFFESGEKYLCWKSKILGSQDKKISGNVAFPGKVVGRAVLHLSWTDTTSLSRGDILVTGMTNPQMVPYIKKAAAIVTDEGGITCHAAIISREMRKPCITGTKNATQLIKTGDMIEVDANEGVVKIVKKA
jgi:phosphohistidine swiveling domain-containing protein